MLGQLDTLDVACRLADYDLQSEVIVNVNCNGSENNLNSCLTALTNNTNCADVPYLKCSEFFINNTELFIEKGIACTMLQLN